MSEPRSIERGTWTRTSIALQVTLTSLLALAAASMLTWLSERPGLRWRVDLTSSGENTLNPATMTVIESLPEGEPVTVDVFFRPEPAPLTEVAAEAQTRFFKQLVLADSLAAGRIRVKNHDFQSQAGPEAEAFLRMRELGVENPNVVVFTRGRLRSVHNLLGDIATLDVGSVLNPQGAFVPPTIESMHTEEVFILGLRKVTQQESLKVYFSTGHEELDIYGDKDGDMGTLHTALVQDGFDIAWWDERQDGAVPEDAAALAIVGASQPFSEAGYREVRNYVLSGGRLLVAPHVTMDSEGSMTQLLSSLGLEPQKGVVSEPYVGPDGQLRVSNERVVALYSDPSEMLPHTITDPLRRANRRLLFPKTRAFLRKSEALPPGGRVLNLVRSDDLAWIDTADENGRPNYRPDEHESRGTHTLAAAMLFAPTLPPRGGAERVRESRVVAIGAADFFANRISPYNRDFLLNSMNWLVGRELRVQVAAKDPDLRRVDLKETTALSTMWRVALIFLPGAFLLCGVIIFFMRRRV